jgi:CDP-paratose 2-epimerase
VSRSNPSSGYALVTGGAGFIGCNLVERLLSLGREVVVLDNFSRKGSERNAEWLGSLKSAASLRIVCGDVRDTGLVEPLVSGASQVFHLAAQVAVTSSLEAPTVDFDVNARGTLTVLEAIRRLSSPPSLLFTSTNKVYGALSAFPVRSTDMRCELEDPELRDRGFGENQPLDFHSPYGCSKGAADQYVLDYARSFAIPTVVFRMSCIYGPHQWGNEDQGWVAHFLMCARKGTPITIYGDGYQVRDVLYVSDLIDAMLLAQSSVRDLAGRAFNIGGGPKNTASLLQVIAQLEKLLGWAPEVRFQGARIGDQRYYVSDVSRFGQATGWKPGISVGEGLRRMVTWLDSVGPEGVLRLGRDALGAEGC